MKITKKISVGGQWAKKGVDIKNGDMVKILNGGQMVSGDYGERQVHKVETKNGEKNVSFNQTSLNACVDAFGEDTEKWIGQELKVTLVKQNVAGKFIDVVYLAPAGWELGEEGFFKASASEDCPPPPSSEDLEF